MTAVVFLRYARGFAATYRSPTWSEQARAQADAEREAAINEQLVRAIGNINLDGAIESWRR